MLQEFVDKILELGKIEQLVINGRTYADRAIQAISDPMKASESAVTLMGFKDLVAWKINGLVPDACYIHVKSHTEVTLDEFACDIWGRRQTHASAHLLADLKSFEFGRFMSQESFIIGLMSMFAPTPDREEVLKLVSNIVGNDVSNSDDDGISQTVSVRQGLALKSQDTVKRVVSLAPYRTFREIAQPASQFVFRLRKSDDGLPALALFEADGGAWRLEAMQDIKKWLQDQDTKIAIIA